MPRVVSCRLMARPLCPPPTITTVVWRAGSGGWDISSLLGVPSTTRRSLDALDDDRRRHAATGAHGDEGALLVAALQLVERRADEDRARGADRMAEGHGTAVHV